MPHILEYYEADDVLIVYSHVASCGHNVDGFYTVLLSGGHKVTLDSGDKNSFERGLQKWLSVSNIRRNKDISGKIDLRFVRKPGSGPPYGPKIVKEILVEKEIRQGFGTLMFSYQIIPENYPGEMTHQECADYDAARWQKDPESFVKDVLSCREVRIHVVAPK